MKKKKIQCSKCGVFLSNPNSKKVNEEQKEPLCRDCAGVEPGYKNPPRVIAKLSRK
jgi:formylmethanofuran dehydrogenase subunit E